VPNSKEHREVNQTQTETQAKTEFSIHPATLIGDVSLSVSNLDKQIKFYQSVLGMKLHWRKENAAGMGGGGLDVLRLTEEPAFRRYREATGLYHFAVLFPNRRELARAVRRLFDLKYGNYPTDHIMTKTTYLDDPEGNGIELYAESPEDGTWSLPNGEYVTRRADGSLSDGREPLDVEALFSHLMNDDRLDAAVPAETRIGHVHLHVGNLDRAVAFYHDVIGFDVMGVAKAFRMGFVSAGGYHHHVGLNTWKGEQAPPAPADALGLRSFTVRLPNETELERVAARIRARGVSTQQTEEGLFVRDPSGNGVVLAALGVR
jgi:catechol 2,3-dioxygenase